jgi:glucokinase
VPVAIAIDVGGTKLAAGLVDDHGNLGARASVATPAGNDGEALFVRLASLVQDVVAGAQGLPPPVVCGVGSGGPMTPGGELVSPLNITAWRDFPLRSRLAEFLGLPTFVDNDAKALALGEGWVGAAAGCRDFLAMVVSTGVGGGLVVDGRLLDGGAGNAGHIGHVIVEPGGMLCACGARGCLEAEASGTSIRAATGAAPASAPLAVRQRAGRLVGRAVASVANLLDLRLALVAGSVALGFGRPFFEAAQAEVDRSARLDFSRGTEVRPAGLGPDGPLVGAAAVAWRAIGVDIGIG